MGVTRMDKIRNEHIRGTAGVERMSKKLRETRLRWYGHVLRREEGYIGKKIMAMELPGTRRRGRPKRRFIDALKEDMRVVGVRKEDAMNRNGWRAKIKE